MMKRIVRRCVRVSPRLKSSCTLAFVSDIHNMPAQELLSAMRGVDAIVLTGDLLDRHHRGLLYASCFLRDASRVAPVCFSLGNHEVLSRDWPGLREWLKLPEVHVIDNTTMRLRDDLILGGLTSKAAKRDGSAMLRELAGADGFRLLLCHHPETAVTLPEKDSDLILSGHAHGGQVALGPLGVYAPGQGLFARYVRGWYRGGHLLVSRGVSNATWAPRISNPCELILLTLTPGQEGYYDEPEISFLS